jgi:penicillin amidase
VPRGPLGADGRARMLILAAGVLVALAAAALALSPAARSAPGGEITIIRDQYGVPHVFAPKRRQVSYGAGYALAQDRLWQMHVFRLIAKGRLSELLGPVVLEIDREVRFFTYTAEEREQRFKTYPRAIKADLRAFVEGVNAWIDEVNADPAKRPFELQEFGISELPEWTVDDSLALQDVLILTFGSGGGNELEHAALLDTLVNRLGKRKGRAAFGDLVHTTDPDATPTIPRRLDWRQTPTGARKASVEKARELNDDARLSVFGEGEGPPEEEGEDPIAPGRASAGSRTALGTLDQLGLIPDPQRAASEAARVLDLEEKLALAFHFGSNAQIVGPQLGARGNTLQTGGPQVGYLVPQWLADIGLHGGGFDAMGMTFAGVGPAVLIGRGPGYAWTTTTGSSDLTDTYVERLRPGEPREYRFRGEWERMDCRTETYEVRGAQFESEEICRTRHGPVAAFDETNNRAYALRYGWFNREVQTVRGFFGFNFVAGLRGFATRAGMLGSNHNMFYVDDRGHFGYWTPGNHPLRAKGVDLRLPQDGTGGSEWRGLVRNQAVPHAVDFGRGWLANWNNLPATGWARERAYSARDNVDDLVDAYTGPSVADPSGGRVNRDREWEFEELSANLRRAALHDHAETWYRSAFPKPKRLGSELARRALEVLRSWDGFLVDEDDDGNYDSAGVTILHRWLSVMREMVFADELGEDVGWARIETELWHAISPDSRYRLRFDWTDGRSPRALAAAAFERAVAELAEEMGGEDPAAWLAPTQYEHYQRLNADLFTDLGTTTSCDQLAELFPFCPAPGGDQTEDSGFPGDVPDQIAMDRGTYNHVIEYERPPGNGQPGSVPVNAGSVIPPGQSGFISPTGEESPHFEDQHPLYAEWRYKPMPLTRAEAREVAASTERISYSP